MNSYSNVADDRLVSLYANGDNRAFDVLLERHQSKIFNYIYYVVHDEDVANDIFQDTFIKAIMTIKQGRYVESGKFAAWLTRIAHNLVIDHFRYGNDGQNNIAADEEGAGALNDIRLSEGNIEMQMVALQRLADLRELVSRLPAPQREVVYMRYYQELTFKEIAEITGVSINTSLGRMRYALINLRRLINQKQLALA